MRLKSDLVELIIAAQQGSLDTQCRMGFTSRDDGGDGWWIPSGYQMGAVIDGLQAVGQQVMVFHAGTKQVDDQVVTNGGRVLCVSALEDSLQLAHDKVYRNIDKVSWPQCFYRRDIGYRALS